MDLFLLIYRANLKRLHTGFKNVDDTAWHPKSWTPSILRVIPLSYAWFLTNVGDGVRRRFRVFSVLSIFKV